MSTVSEVISTIKKKLPKSIQTKITNNNGKCGTKGPLSTQRTKRTGRVTLPLNIVKKNGLTSIEQLKTFYEGVVIVLENGDYFELINNTDEFSKYLIANIGGDDTVSSIIAFMSTNGDSGSAIALSWWEKFQPEKIKNNYIPVKRKPDYKKKGNVTEGNDKWEGHYYVEISGGSNDKAKIIKSHEKITPEFQLFIEYHDYANENVCTQIDATMIYYLLHAHDIEIYIERKDVDKYISELEGYLKSIQYDDGNLYDTYLIKEECIRSSEKYGGKKVLYCPLTMNELSIKINFEYSKKDEDDSYSINICHNEAVKKRKVIYDKSQQYILTAARPQNLFWGTKVGNMQQQDFTIDEYWNDTILKAAKRSFNTNK